MLPDFAERNLGFLGKLLPQWTPQRGQLVKLDADRLTEDQAWLVLMIGMVEELQLHLRLWSKP